MSGPEVTVVICTRNPHPGRFARTLAGLREQTLAPARWELVVVDNGSDERPVADDAAGWHPAGRVVREPRPGLTAAREAGLRAARGALVVFVDDDNVLCPQYLAAAAELFDRRRDVGTAGGVIRPEYEVPPPAWFGPHHEFLLALRDLGGEERVSASPEAGLSILPFGAGMVMRRAAVDGWLNGPKRLTDRVGNSLASCGDTDIVLATLRAGWRTAYHPALRLTHLIPPGRLDRRYLARLAREAAKTYAQALALHGFGSRPRIPVWTVPLRKLRAFVRCRAWAGPAGYVRWKAACGQFEGLAAPLTPHRSAPDAG